MLVILGLVVGVVSGLLGVGGGFMNVPVLHFFGGLSFSDAVGTSLLIVSLTSLSSAFGHFWRGRVDALLGVVLEVATVPGALAGALITSVVDERMIGSIFAVGLVIVGITMASGRSIHWNIGMRPFLRRKLTRRGGELFEYEVSLPAALVGSFVAGVASGFLGIGGGVIKVPLLVALGVPIHIAVGTSCFMMTLTALAGVAMHATIGQVNLTSALAMGAGAVIGGQVGSALSGRIKALVLRRLFGLFLSCVGGYILLSVTVL